MQGFPMPSYDSFMCPNCEHHFRVIWPECLPTHYHLCSKIKIKCPDCGEVTELYDFLIDEIMQALEPGIPSVEVLSISPHRSGCAFTIITMLIECHLGRFLPSLQRPKGQ